MSLLYGNRLNVAILTDFAKGNKRKIEELRKSQLLGDARVLTAELYTGTEEADIEDLIGRDGYVELVRQAYGVKSLKLGKAASDRVVKDVEDAFRVLPPATPEFDHFFPSSFLVENPAVLKALPDADAALDRFEKLFTDLNKFL
jgi:hypothetical protein